MSKTRSFLATSTSVSLVGMQSTLLLLLLPFFTPPPEFKDDFGHYAPPLVFANGSKVASKADWTRRRAEILNIWTGYLGEWPALIEKPHVEYVNRTHRENFVQHRIRVEVAPGQMLEGYLLVPNGHGPFPAVIVPYYEPESSIGV